MYTIYKIASPSGKFYIGLTSQTVKARWDSHCTVAFRGQKWSPFHCAIRKYGKAAFTLEVIETVPDLAAANAAEIKWIAALRSTDRDIGYNFSPGGGYDSLAGVEGMRIKMADPEWAAGYKARLSRGIRASRSAETYLIAIEAAKRWRADNPRQSYENGRRAVRMATKANGYEWHGVPGKSRNTIATWGRLWIPSERVLFARRSYFAKRHVTEKWAALDVDSRDTLRRQISEGQKAAYQRDPERKAKNFEQMKAARANVDRKKQAAAASAGQKQYWVDLRKDPERYAAYMERRRATLIATLKKKSDLRRAQRGTEKPLHDGNG